MAIDAALKAFLDLTEDEIAAYADRRAAALGLILPGPTVAAVRENLALLRAQTALFVVALGDEVLGDEALGDEALGDEAGDTPATFQP